MKLGLAASTSEMMSRRKLSTCPAHLCSIFLNFNSKNITCTSRMKEPAGHPRSRRNPATRPALPKVAEQNPIALQDWADVGLPAKEKNVAACVNMSLPMSPKEKHKLHVTQNTTSRAAHPVAQKRIRPNQHLQRGTRCQTVELFNVLNVVHIKVQASSGGAIGLRVLDFNGAVHLREQDYRCTSM